MGKGKRSGKGQEKVREMRSMCKGVARDAPGKRLAGVQSSSTASTASTSQPSSLCSASRLGNPCPGDAANVSAFCSAFSLAGSSPPAAEAEASSKSFLVRAGTLACLNERVVWTGRTLSPSFLPKGGAAARAAEEAEAEVAEEDEGPAGVYRLVPE